MSYTKQNFKNGDVLTAEQLNNIEDGLVNLRVTAGQKEGSALGSNATAEGVSTIASGNISHAEGDGTKAIGTNSHAEGKDTEAHGEDSHAEGRYVKAYGTKSHAEGESTIAEGPSSHAEGIETKAIANGSHAEGFGTTTLFDESENADNSFYDGETGSTLSRGQGSHVEGVRTSSKGIAAHAEGVSSKANGLGSHAEGYYTTASRCSHAEGYRTTSISTESGHIEGHSTTQGSDFNAWQQAILSGQHDQAFSCVAGDGAHVEGADNYGLGHFSHAEGSLNVAYSINSHAEGLLTQALGNESHTEGTRTIAYSAQAHAGGSNTTVGKLFTNSSGIDNVQTGEYAKAAFAHGIGLQASAPAQAVFGKYNEESEDALFIVGNGSSANDRSNVFVIKANNAHAEGQGTVASGYSSHAEGTCIPAETIEIGLAEETYIGGINCIGIDALLNPDNKYIATSGYGSGQITILNKIQGSGNYLHYYTFEFQYGYDGYPFKGGTATIMQEVLQKETQASGDGAHAEGVGTTASGYASHSEGLGTIASSKAQHVQGKYNLENSSYAHIIGNGTKDARSNAHTIDWNGNAWFAGAIDVEDKATTLSNIGAAPAGYGLGETNGRAITSWAEFDAATENGWYFLKNWTYGSHIMGGSGATKEQVASFISDFPEFAELGGNTITGLVFAQSIDENSGFQEFYPFTNGVVLRRARVAGVWQPFEWVNPLMLVGREYRTTKRYQGKAVYTKAINIGALPNNSTSSTKNLNTYGKRIVSAVLSLENPSDGRSCNVNTSNTSFTVAHSGDNWLWCSVKTTKDESAYNGILTIEYTKD